MYAATVERRSFILAVSADVPQSATWSPLLFYPSIHFLPSVVQFSSAFVYGDDQSLLKIIPLMKNRLRTADKLNANLTAFPQFGKQWFIDLPLQRLSLYLSH